MDVTERRKVEQALKDSEEMFRNPVEQSPVGVFLFQDGAVRYSNPKLAEMFGYTREEVTTTGLARVIEGTKEGYVDKDGAVVWPPSE
jgi:PAS domain S-box-containing protein